jgi:hypothetical protein
MMHVLTLNRAYSPFMLPSLPMDALLMQEQDGGYITQGHHGHNQERGVLIIGLEHLPPPGIKQVFEADVGVGVNGPRHQCLVTACAAARVIHV